jgi:hypothetical protein
MKFGGFHLNLAAGLEDSLIRDLRPVWNGGRKEIADTDTTIPQPSPVALSEVMPTDDTSSEDVAEQRLVGFDQPHLPVKVTTEDFRDALRLLFVNAMQSGLPHLDVRSGELHNSVGAQNQMPQVCSAMRSMRCDLDEVLESPPKGNGSRLVIRYKIPRPT